MPIYVFMSYMLIIETSSKFIIFGRDAISPINDINEEESAENDIFSLMDSIYDEEEK